MATQEIIIQGLTLAGKPFRPSDWVRQNATLTLALARTSHVTHLT